LRRTNRNGLKRIGVLALALVIALGALGVAYAAWTDSVYIQGTVNTGTLDIDIDGASSTFVYKVPGGADLGWGPETVVHYVPGAVDLTPPTDPGTTLIASAVTVADNTPDADTATITFSGLFPDIDFIADLELEYLGSVPAKVQVAEIYANDIADTKLAALWTLGEVTKNNPPALPRYGAWIDGELSVNDGYDWTYIDDPLGLQLHKYDLVHITLHVNLPEEEEFQNLVNLSFTGVITVIQWNEYED
jgi:hypothetical protein